MINNSIDSVLCQSKNIKSNDISDIEIILPPATPLKTVFIKEKELNIGNKNSYEQDDNIKKEKQVEDWIAIDHKGIERIRPAKLARYIIREYKHIIYLAKTYWQYQGKIWKQVDDLAINQQIQDVVWNYNDDLCSDRILNNVSTQIKNNVFKDQNEIILNNDKNLICFENGVYDIENKQLKKHSPKYYQTFMLPYNFDSLKKCPKWMNFLKELEFSDSNTILRLQEWFGYCLVPHAHLDKCLYLKGEGDNGKSVFIDTLVYMIGKENMAAIEPVDLFKPFELQGLFGKLINVCADIVTDKVLSQSFKKIVSGDDVDANVKYKNNIKFKPFAKHIFSANNYIPTKDRSHGFFRRFDIIDFKKVFPKSEQDKLLSEKLQKEIQGIFNWALEGLYRLKTNKWLMTQSKDFDSTHEEFKTTSNPVAMLLRDCFEEMDIEYFEKSDFKCEDWEKHSRENSISKKEFRQKYISYCSDNGYKILNEVNLGKEMIRLGYQDKRVRVLNKRLRIYENLKILND